MSPTQLPLLSQSTFADTNALEENLKESLGERVKNGREYTMQEIETVSLLDRRLFPEGFELDYLTSENFRRMTALTNLELNTPAAGITSHRRFIGPVIVFLKKASWPLIRIHLRKRFEAMSELTASMTYQLARQFVELQELRSRSENG